MKYRILGKDLKVSAIVLGCMGMSHAYGAPADKKEMRELLAQAVDMGYTFFDTAEVYGTPQNPHDNEELVGNALKEYRNKIVLATKFGIRFDMTSSQVNKPLIADSRPDEIRKAVEASLKRLNTDHIDLYYQHRVDPTISIEEVAGVMQELIKEGKITLRKNLGQKPWIYPLPVLIIGTYGEDGKANAMNAAWGGIYEADQVILCLSEGHKTTQNIKSKGAFTISFADVDHVVEADYVGMVSANDVQDKMEKAGFHTTKSEYVDAPIINELPMALECKLIKINEDGNIIGKIVNVSVDECILDENGNIDTAKLQAISFAPVHNAYLKVGEKVGNAFKDGAILK